MQNGGVARPAGAWEVLGILAAVIPCGILAGLYLATNDGRFLAACGVLAVVAVGIIFARNLGRLRLPRRERAGAAAANASAAGHRKIGMAGAMLRRTFTIRVLKLLGMAVWLLAWAVVASLYARVAENANMPMLVMLVIFGGFSPIVMYYGLESGVKRLSGRERTRSAETDD